MAEEDNPVRSGVIALVAVAVVVGLLAGFAALLGSSMLGFGDDNGSASDTSDIDAGDSLFMPDYVPTEVGSGPLITLLPTGTDSASESSSSKSADGPEKKKRKKPKKAKNAITLSQGASEVAPGQELYLSGIYPSGEGASLDIQVRSEGGEWADFPVDVSVSNKTFSTYVYTDKTGDLEWRVIDKSNGKTSNPVKVTHG
ncbi:MAG: hypothetical protein L0H93_02560 [Nocardioides sp.]|nr:hypothetical protein [Nocardioides sp.]